MPQQWIVEEIQLHEETDDVQENKHQDGFEQYPQHKMASAIRDACTMQLEQYRTQVEAALEYSGQSHTFEDVQAMVGAGQAQFWPGPSSVIITQIVSEPRKTVLHFFLAGGNLAELEAMTPIVLKWGRERGCTSASLIGRKGWEKTFLTRQGWTNGLVVLEKSLDEQE